MGNKSLLEELDAGPWPQFVDSLNKNRKRKRYLCLIGGGRGDNVWDREVQVLAENIADVVKQVESELEYDEDIHRIELDETL